MKGKLINGLMRAWLALLPCCLVVPQNLVASTGPFGGEAVVVDVVGDVSAHIMEGSAYEMRRRRVPLHRNASVGSMSQISTGRGGQVHLLLSTGVLLAVGPNSTIVIEQLRHTSQGLPRREEDLVRQVHVRVNRGRVQVHGGAPRGTLDLRILTPVGMVSANGGTFSVAQLPEGDWGVFNESGEQRVIPEARGNLTLRGRRSARMWRDNDGQALARLDDDLGDSDLRYFPGSLALYNDLAPFMDTPGQFDRQALGVYLGGGGADIEFLGGDVQVGDVSPSFRPVPVANVRPGVDLSLMPGGARSGQRWDRQRIWAWYEDLGAVRGVNYVPRYAVNSVEMWMAEHFDPEIIEEELVWAREAGYTSVRVQLQAVVWQADPEGFMERFEQFLALAAEQRLHVVPILFDDLNLSGEEPSVGPQRDPTPGQHNARWLPSPGHAQVVDPDRWGDLEAFVKTIMEKYRRDKRILYWDMYNMAGAGPEVEDSLPLMDASLRWARDTDPEQPIAVAVWSRLASAMSSHKLELSDIITFQSFESSEQVEARLSYLARFERPIICTDWLMRQRGNDFESILPLFSRNKVGWFNRGLVNGRTQKWIQQVEFRSVDDPDLWQHDVLKADGSPYRQEEIDAIRAFRFIDE